MSKALFSVGDKVKLSVDGFAYRVDTITPERDNEPGERMYFLVPGTRQTVRTHLIPERAAKRLMTLIPERTRSE